MSYQSLSRELRRNREENGLSMADVAQEIQQTITHRKQGTFVQAISFFEHNWMELHYAIEGRQPWHQYFQAYRTAVHETPGQKQAIDRIIEDITSNT